MANHWCFISFSYSYPLAIHTKASCPAAPIQEACSKSATDTPMFLTHLPQAHRQAGSLPPPAQPQMGGCPLPAAAPLLIAAADHNHAGAAAAVFLPGSAADPAALQV
eukprot:191125-Pelagomonas_calceolata.AAC.3